MDASKFLWITIGRFSNAHVAWKRLRSHGLSLGSYGIFAASVYCRFGRLIIMEK